MTKRLRKEIMKRSKLRNKINFTLACICKTMESKGKNVQKLLRNAKQQYFNNLNFKSITDSKKFMNAVKTLFSNKSKTANIIME